MLYVHTVRVSSGAGNNVRSTVMDRWDLIHDRPKRFYYDQDDRWVFPRFKNKVFVQFKFYTNWLICITKFVHILIRISHCISNMATKYFRALSYCNLKKTKLIACDRCFSSDVKIVDTFVNKPSFVFILLFLFTRRIFCSCKFTFR